MDRFGRVACLALVAVLLAGCGSSPDSTVIDEAAGGDTSAATDDASVPVTTAGAGGPVVDVAGAVRRPGVYRMQPGARVHEAIEAAGGPTTRADLSTLNRAAVLVDGQQVLVARAGDPGAAGEDEAAAAEPVGTVSINVADVAALDTLPGIGPVTAERIVAERETGGPYRDVDDLDRVPGIGPATIESLRDAVTA